MKKGCLKRRIRRESREKIEKLEFEGEIEGAGARWGRVGGGTRRARGETRSDLRCPGRGGPGGRALLPAPLPAAAVRVATFLRVSHTLAIKESPKPRLFPRPSPARAGETIFHPLLIFNLLWGKKAAFVGQGAARRAGRGRRRLCVPQLRAWGRRGGAAGARGRSAGAEGPEVEPGRGGAQGRGADGLGRSTGRSGGCRGAGCGREGRRG